MESINHINRPLQISTITACANAKNVVINLQKIYDHLITKIVKVEEPKVEKSSTPTKTEVSSKEKKSSVFDSIDLKKDDPIQTKVIVNKETNKVPIKEVKK